MSDNPADAIQMEQPQVPMKYLHTMVRVTDIDASLAFYCDALGLEEINRYDSEEGRFSLIFMAPPGQEDAPIELTYNWDGDDKLPSDSRHFGHLAYGVARTALANSWSDIVILL